METVHVATTRQHHKTGKTIIQSTDSARSLLFMFWWWCAHYGRHIRRQRVAQYVDYSLHELTDITTRLYAERYQQRRHPTCRKCIFLERRLQETDCGPIWQMLVDHKVAGVAMWKMFCLLQNDHWYQAVGVSSTHFPVTFGEAVTWSCTRSKYCMFKFCNRRWIMSVQMISANGYCSVSNLSRPSAADGNGILNARNQNM